MSTTTEQQQQQQPQQTTAITTTTQQNITLEGQELKDAIRKQVEWYLSRQNLSTDVYLVSHMDDQKYVSLELLAGFKMLKQLTTDLDLIRESIKDSTEVQLLDVDGGLRVRPTFQIVRNTVVLRDINKTIEEQLVLALFAEDNKPTSLKPDIGDTWFAVFGTEQCAMSALEHLRTQKFQGREVRARIKSESILKSAGGVVPTLTGPVFSKQHHHQHPQRHHYHQHGDQQQQQQYYHSHHSMMDGSQQQQYYSSTGRGGPRTGYRGARGRGGRGINATSTMASATGKTRGINTHHQQQYDQDGNIITVVVDNTNNVDINNGEVSIEQATQQLSLESTTSSSESAANGSSDDQDQSGRRQQKGTSTTTRQQQNGGVADNRVKNATATVGRPPRSGSSGRHGGSMKKNQTPPNFTATSFPPLQGQQTGADVNGYIDNNSNSFVKYSKETVIGVFEGLVGTIRQGMPEGMSKECTGIVSAPYVQLELLKPPLCSGQDTVVSPTMPVQREQLEEVFTSATAALIGAAAAAAASSTTASSTSPSSSSQQPLTTKSFVEAAITAKDIQPPRKSSFSAGSKKSRSRANSRAVGVDNTIPKPNGDLLAKAKRALEKQQQAQQQEPATTTTAVAAAVAPVATKSSKKPVAVDEDGEEMTVVVKRGRRQGGRDKASSAATEKPHHHNHGKGKNADGQHVERQPKGNKSNSSASATADSAPAAPGSYASIASKIKAAAAAAAAQQGGEATTTTEPTAAQ